MLTRKSLTHTMLTPREHALQLQLARLERECERLKRAWMQESARAEEYRSELKAAVLSCTL